MLSEDMKKEIKRHNEFLLYCCEEYIGEFYLKKCYLELLSKGVSPDDIVDYVQSFSNTMPPTVSKEVNRNSQRILRSAIEEIRSSDENKSSDGR